MKILMVASEAVPYAKTGGLADVAGVLPKFLRQLGHDVRVVIPLYGSIDRWKYRMDDVPGAMGVWMGVMGELWCGIKESRLPNSDVPVYFIDYERFYARPQLYNEPNGQGFMDNDNRFVFLSRAALQLCKKLDFAPDIVHCNDWHTAAVPIFLNTVYRDDPFFSHTASLLTIHNMEYQGRYYSGLMDVLDIGWEHFNHLELEWQGQVNLLKGGIYHSTLFNAVSHGYAAEILTPQFGHGLEGVVQDRRDALRGVLNGIDYEEWNPAHDVYITAPYDKEHGWESGLQTRAPRRNASRAAIRCSALWARRPARRSKGHTAFGRSFRVAHGARSSDRAIGQWRVLGARLFQRDGGKIPWEICLLSGL